ncbi:UNVERIFIED_CONTAM: hypothetical protein GTU68_022721, partial [Idotea baltica]|nr:hypothetical protein [Idotea baltica]
VGKFVKFKDKAGEFRFNLKSDNGQTILTSEGYKAEASCDNGIASVKKNSSEDARYERKEAANGKFHFNLKATNGQVIGVSQMYASEATRDAGIKSVMSNAPSASVETE